VARAVAVLDLGRTSSGHDQLDRTGLARPGDDHARRETDPGNGGAARDRAGGAFVLLARRMIPGFWFERGIGDLGQSLA
jgi:hypothetical protein